MGAKPTIPTVTRKGGVLAPGDWFDLARGKFCAERTCGTLTSPGSLGSNFRNTTRPHDSAECALVAGGVAPTGRMRKTQMTKATSRAGVTMPRAQLLREGRLYERDSRSDVPRGQDLITCNIEGRCTLECGEIAKWI